MYENEILKRERELKQLKKSLKRLKASSVMVSLTNRNPALNRHAVSIINGFIIRYFNQLVYQDNVVDEAHILILYGNSSDICKAIYLASQQTSNPDVKAAYEKLSEEVENAEEGAKLIV